MNNNKKILLESDVIIKKNCKLAIALGSFSKETKEYVTCKKKLCKMLVIHKCLFIAEEICSVVVYGSSVMALESKLMPHVVIPLP